MPDQLAPPGTFRRFIWDALSSPRTFRGHFGRRFFGTIGLMLDDLAEATSQAVQVAWILRNPPPDALGPIGREAMLRRYPTEATAQYKSRIARAWADWEVAGDESSIINQLAAAGHPGAVIYRWLGSSSWSEFVVFFPAGTHNVTSAGPLVGSFTVGDGSIIGIVGMSPVELNTLRGIVRQWKPGRWKCVRIVFELSGWTIGTEHTVGEVDLVIGGSQAFVGAL
jgi:hypothetical protein